jgi:hypothetical protein
MPKKAITSSVQPPAVAYVRLADDEDADVLARLLKDIAACCVREGVRLVRTFTDRGYDGTQLARPGIVGLQEALKETRGMAVVLPTLEHLSPADSMRRALVSMVRRLDGELIVMNEEASTDSGGGVPGAGSL